MRSADGPSEEVSCILETLNERLARAEAELADRRSHTPRHMDEGSGSTTRTVDSTKRTKGSRILSEIPYSTTITSPQEVADYTDQAHQDQGEKDMVWVPETAPTTTITTTTTPPPSTCGIDDTRALPQGLINELQESYFDSVQHCLPIVNKNRYLQKADAFPATHELKCLNYAIWTHGALCCNKHESVEELCYLQSRSLLEQAEMTNGGTSFQTIEALQACLLIAVYENKRMYFTRAWITLGRALRLAQMMKLHLLDLEQAQAGGGDALLGDWLELEERRRVFWVGFILDRCMSNGRDWPMLLEDNPRMIHLPSAEPVGAENTRVPISPYQSLSLHDYLASPFPPPLSLFAHLAVVAALWGRCMKHLHDSHKIDAQTVLPIDFWASHHKIETLVLQISAAAGSHFISPHSNDPNAIFLTMMLHTINIYLHHSAAAYAVIAGLSGHTGPDSDARCDAAAMEIAGSARMNLFAARCLYAAARVLVERIKGLRGDARSLDSLHSILGIMDAWKRENPLVELYIKQISQDLKGNEVSDLTRMPY